METPGFISRNESHFKLPKEYVSAFQYNDYSIPIHTHEFYEMNIVTSGSGIHCIEENRLKVSRGDVFVIPPSVCHGYENTEKLCVYHILIHPAFMKQIEKEGKTVEGFTLLTEIEPFLRARSSELMFLHLSELEFMEIEHDIKMLDSGGRFTSERFFPLRDHIAVKLLYYFSYLLSKQAPQQKNHQILMSALEFIHTHYDEKLTIDTICKALFTSRSTLVRAFDEVLSVSPHLYIRRFRKNKAIGLLSEGMSKTQTAVSCGYYDVSHMCKELENGSV